MDREKERERQRVRKKVGESVKINLNSGKTDENNEGTRRETRAKTIEGKGPV